MTESFLKMTENDRDRKWPLSKHQKTIPKAAFAIRCENRKHLYLYTSTTYALFFNILREKACFLLRIFVSLHRQSKEQSSCAKSRSSMKTEAGLNRWQALVINEDHKMGRKRLSGELWFKELLNADRAWSTSRTFKTSRKTPALQTSGESYSSPSTLQLSNPISLALSGPKVK